MNIDILIACIGIFIWELYGNFVWGWSIVTQIFLQNIIWFEIKNAIALDNAAVLWSQIGLLFMLLRKENVEKWMWVIAWAALFWAYLWANLLYALPSDYVKVIFTLAIVWLVIKNFFFPSHWEQQKKWFILNKKNLVLLCFAAFFIATYNAFLSIWNFIFGLLILTSIFHFTYHRALFILSFAFVFARTLGTYEYMRLWLLDFDFFIPMFVTAFASGIIVGSLVHKIQSNTLNMFLKYFSVLLALYLIMQLF